jgi:integrase
MKQRSDEPPKRDNDGLHRRRGIWYYTLNIDGERRFFSTKTTNYQQARKVRSQAEEDQKAGKLPNDLSKWPFEKLLAHVREQRKLHLAENTIRLEKERSVQLLKHFTGMRVSKIDATAIRNYQQTRSKTVSPRTVNLEIKILRHVLQPAKTWAAIAPDYKRLPEDRRGPGKAIEEAQERLLFDTARSKPGWDAAFYAAMVAANTTARGVEIKNLHIGDLNLIDREVSVKRSKGNTAGVRRIPLNAGAMWGFVRLIERARALGSVAPEHFLLPRFKYRSKTPGHGNGYDPTRPQKTWRTAWRALVKETGRRAGRAAAEPVIKSGKGWRPALAAWRRAAAPFRGLRFHDLRHLAVTKLAESEASDATIMAIAGHMSREMMEHYSHVRAAAKRKAVEAIPSYVPQELPATNPTTKRPQ